MRFFIFAAMPSFQTFGNNARFRRTSLDGTNGWIFAESSHCVLSGRVSRCEWQRDRVAGGAPSSEAPVFDVSSLN